MNFDLLPDWKDVAKTSWSIRLWGAATALGVLWQMADAVFDYPVWVGTWVGNFVLFLGALGIFARLIDQHRTPPAGNGDVE